MHTTERGTTQLIDTGVNFAVQKPNGRAGEGSPCEKNLIPSGELAPTFSKSWRRKTEYLTVFPPGLERRGRGIEHLEAVYAWDIHSWLILLSCAA